jgi:hypothetical protein
MTSGRKMNWIAEIKKESKFSFFHGLKRKWFFVIYIFYFQNHPIEQFMQKSEDCTSMVIGFRRNRIKFKFSQPCAFFRFGVRPTYPLRKKNRHNTY